MCPTTLSRVVEVIVTADDHAEEISSFPIVLLAAAVQQTSFILQKKGIPIA
jgi:hypothetical protein